MFRQKQLLTDRDSNDSGLLTALLAGRRDTNDNKIKKSPRCGD